jgi:hypothetical protein
MSDEETRYSSTKLEVIVTGGEMQLRIDGSPISPATRFAIDDDAISDIKTEYMLLDEAGHEGRKEESKAREDALGRRLGELLLGTTGPASAHSLARSLHRCLRQNEIKKKKSTNETEHLFVRLTLSFDDAKHADLPWELALWDQPWTREEIHLGHDPRIALTRFERGRGVASSRRIFGRDRVLSILNIGADTSTAGVTHYEFTRDLLRSFDERIPQLHATSFWFPELDDYYRDSERLAGKPLEFDIVHWRGHGDSRKLEAPRQVPPNEEGRISLSPADLFQRTRGAFLYVVLACDSGGGPPPSKGEPLERLDDFVPHTRFSPVLLAAGAPAVLGVYYIVGQTEFECLPDLYPLLYRGLPLDYGVQHLRRSFALRNVESGPALYAGWYKLILHTTADRYLDGEPANTP